MAEAALPKRDPSTGTERLRTHLGTHAEPSVRPFDAKIYEMSKHTRPQSLMPPRAASTAPISGTTPSATPGLQSPGAAAPVEPDVTLAIDPLLLATARVSTFSGPKGLTNASGFFFQRDDRLYLVSSRHVFIDEDSKHHPDRLEIELHPDALNLGASIGLSVLLYEQGVANWRQGTDAGGDIDVAVLRINRSALPAQAALAAFTEQDLQTTSAPLPLGEPLLIPGFPLGFHDALHHLPVVRQGIVASPYGWRFQGKACFLTDARTHRGISGAPVVARAPTRSPLPWRLAGIHSSRLDIASRDLQADESLGLNIAWYPDILLTLTTA